MIRTLAAWIVFVIGASGVYVASQDWYDTSQRGFEYMPDMGPFAAIRCLRAESGDTRWQDPAGAGARHSAARIRAVSLRGDAGGCRAGRPRTAESDSADHRHACAGPRALQDVLLRLPWRTRERRRATRPTHPQSPCVLRRLACAPWQRGRFSMSSPGAQAGCRRYAIQIRPEQRWLIVHFVMSLREEGGTR